MQHHGGGAIGAIFMLFELVICGGLYVFSSMAFQLIAKKTNTPNDWMAWVPILNTWLLVQVAGKEVLWFVLCLIPCVGLFAGIMVMMAVAEKLGKPSSWGILMIVPIYNLYILYMMAWGD